MSRFILLFDTCYSIAESEAEVNSVITAMNQGGSTVLVRVYHLGEEVMMERCWRVPPSDDLRGLAATRSGPKKEGS